jgi:hypothetical protein
MYGLDTTQLEHNLIKTLKDSLSSTSAVTLKKNTSELEVVHFEDVLFLQRYTLFSSWTV